MIAIWPACVLLGTVRRERTDRFGARLNGRSSGSLARRGLIEPHAGGWQLTGLGLAALERWSAVDIDPDDEEAP